MLWLRYCATDYTGFKKIEGLLNTETLSRHEKVMLNEYITYAEQSKAPDIHEFAELMQHKNFPKADSTVYNRIIENMKAPLEEHLRVHIVEQVLQQRTVAQLTKLILEYEAGADVSVLDTLSDMLAETAELRKKNNEEATFACLEELSNNAVEARKFTWPLDCLNECLRPLEFGDDLCLGARPDMGKTTILANISVGIAKQTFENEIILWLNNEGPKKKVLHRIVQAVLGATSEELGKLDEQGRLISEYEKILGSKSKIQVYDIHGWNTKQVEDLIHTLNKKWRIVLTIFDMVDNVRLFRARKENRTDENLEKLYIWARDLGTVNNMITIKSSQISAYGHGQPYPSYAFLKDSQTGKQGATDTIIMLGHTLDEGMENIRFLSAPKNKLHKTGAPALHAQLVIDKDRARFKE